MGSPRKSDRKALLDISAWLFNIVTSVGIIMVNKALMASYGFTFATSLTGMHFVTTTIMTLVFRWLGLIQPSHLPMSEILKFAFFANLSIVGMNVSLMWNSVGFYQVMCAAFAVIIYQYPNWYGVNCTLTGFWVLFWLGVEIAKLCMIPASCLLEVVFDQVRYSRGTKLSITVVLIGVAVCTVSDVSVNSKGLMAAVIAVWSTCLQQYYVHFLQKKYSLNSFNLLGHMAPVQAASLVLVGPFVDLWLTGKRIDKYDYALPSVFFIALSCIIAVGTNLSQFICIGRFSAVSFQVLGHMKTIFVLILGFLFFGKEGLNLQVVLGMIVAICGMVWYGNASSKPGGKERRPHLPQRNNNGFTGEKIHDDEKV